MSRLAAFAALLLVITSAPARADGFFTPFIGDNFGGDAFNCAGLTDCSPRRRSYGVSVGAMGTSVGFEKDLSYAKDFFGAWNGELDVLGHVQHALPGGAGRIQSYIVSGVGLVRARVSLHQTRVDSSVIGYDVGGGVNDFFTKHVGSAATAGTSKRSSTSMCRSPAGSWVSGASASASP